MVHTEMLSKLPLFASLEASVMFGTEFRRLQEAQPSVAAAIKRTARERMNGGAG